MKSEVRSEDLTKRGFKPATLVCDDPRVRELNPLVSVKQGYCVQLSRRFEMLAIKVATIKVGRAPVIAIPPAKSEGPPQGKCPFGV